MAHAMHAQFDDVIKSDAQDFYRTGINFIFAGLIRLQELLKATSSKIESFYITLRRLEEIPEGSGDYRTTLKEIRSRGDSKIVLDCDWRKVHAVLKQVCYWLDRRNTPRSTNDSSRDMLVIYLDYMTFAII